MSIDLLSSSEEQENSPERIISPEMEAMADSIAGIVEVAKTRTNISTGQHNKLIRKAESANPLARRPSDEELTEATEESGRDIFALTVAGRMKDIIDAAPKDSETGFALSVLAEGAKNVGGVMKRLEVSKIDEGILFRIVTGEDRKDGKGGGRTFILSDGGYLFHAWYDTNGGRKTYPMQGYLEEKKAKWQHNEEEKDPYLHEAEGPSARLNEDIELFYQAVTTVDIVNGDRYPTAVLPSGVEMTPLKKALEMPQTKLDPTSKYLD